MKCNMAGCKIRNPAHTSSRRHGTPSAAPLHSQTNYYSKPSRRSTTVRQGVVTLADRLSESARRPEHSHGPVGRVAEVALTSLKRMSVLEGPADTDGERFQKCSEVSINATRRVFRPVQGAPRSTTKDHLTVMLGRRSPLKTEHRTKPASDQAVPHLRQSPRLELHLGPQTSPGCPSSSPLNPIQFSRSKLSIQHFPLLPM